jgi:pSer/pThr/pTyr-binding forkhead associated (FHA) protein
MALFLECFEGPVEGQKFRLLPGTRVGRSTGEVLLPDPKVSALHAQVESNEKGQLFLVDRGSSNGLRINGQRVQKIAMLLGVKFQIGKSHFRVIDVPTESSSLLEIHTSEEGWRGKLRTLVPKLSAHNQTSESFVQRFEPIVELEFLEGIQAETKVVVGYGPRKAGSDVLDIELYDPESPDIAFELIPEEDGSVRFRTSHPGLVLVNDTNVSSDILRSGDLIRVGLTLIEVKFLS